MPDCSSVIFSFISLSSESILLSSPPIAVAFALIDEALFAILLEFAEIKEEFSAMASAFWAMLSCAAVRSLRSVSIKLSLVLISPSSLLSRDFIMLSR